MLSVDRRQALIRASLACNRPQSHFTHQPQDRFMIQLDVPFVRQPQLNPPIAIDLRSRGMRCAHHAILV